jgi:hypothetical protein
MATISWEYNGVTPEQLQKMFGGEIVDGAWIAPNIEPPKFTMWSDDTANRLADQFAELRHSFGSAIAASEQLNKSIENLIHLAQQRKNRNLVKRLAARVIINSSFTS